MYTHIIRSWARGMFAAAAALAIAERTNAADQIFVTVVNTTGVAAADLHVTFTGTGGNITVPPLTVIALGCPVPAVPSNGMVTNTAVIDWGAACVPPGAAVTFLARTTNGPLAFSSGVWTGVGGGVIGPAAPAEVIPIGPAPFPFLGLKVQTVYQPPGAPTYSPWQWNGIWLCRRCCWPARKCWFRIFFCPFSNRINRFLELPPWIPIGGWKMGPPIPAKWSWRWIDPWHENPGVLGPPPNQPADPGLPLPLGDFGLGVRYSDDGGANWRVGSDFTSTYYAIRDALDVDAPNRTGPTTFEQFLMTMSPLYSQAAAALSPLITELNNVLAFEPNPNLQTMRNDAMTMQTNMNNIATQLNTGHPTNPTPFFNVANAMASTGAAMQGLGNMRYANAATHIQGMGGGFFTAGQQVAGGLDDMMEMGEFFWAMIDRVPTMSEHVATGAFPHIQIQVDLGGWPWYGFTMNRARVIVQSMSTGNVIDEFEAQLSDFNRLTLPLIQTSGQLRICVKFPTHLSRCVVVTAQDGMVVGPIFFKRGDANGDDCINSTDRNMVLADQGQGGFGAPSVPSTDVNGDGVVNMADNQVVLAGLGECGDHILLTSCPADISPPPMGNGFVNIDDLFGVIGAWGPCPQPCPPRCRGDIVPYPNGNCVVNIDDLFAVIAQWGQCPQ
jgi:hypothetical protein